MMQPKLNNMKHLKPFEKFNIIIESIEQNINVVDTIKRSDIEGSVQPDAKYAQLNPSGEFIQKFYKMTNVELNDNTNTDVLQYWGDQGGWHNSSYNSRDIDKLQNHKFLEIID